MACPLTEFYVAEWLPCGHSGPWEVARFGRTATTFCTVLRHGFDTWMTDIDVEILDSWEFCQFARGRILITGLGLGCVPAWLARKSDIKSIDIIELNADVIALVGPHLQAQSPKIKIHHGDALMWQPQSQWDWAWHDIWPIVATAEQADEIEAKYSPFATNQLSWRYSHAN